MKERGGVGGLTLMGFREKKNVLSSIWDCEDEERVTLEGLIRPAEMEGGGADER